jgi:hypothetical protein
MCDDRLMVAGSEVVLVPEWAQVDRFAQRRVHRRARPPDAAPEFMAAPVSIAVASVAANAAVKAIATTYIRNHNESKTCQGPTPPPQTSRTPARVRRTSVRWV